MKIHEHWGRDCGEDCEHDFGKSDAIRLYMMIASRLVEHHTSSIADLVVALGAPNADPCPTCYRKFVLLMAPGFDLDLSKPLSERRNTASLRVAIGEAAHAVVLANTRIAQKIGEAIGDAVLDAQHGQEERPKDRSDLN